jgi:hypothetical protein
VLDSQRVKQRWARSPIQKALQWGDLVWRSLSDVGRSYEITSRLEVLAASYHGAAWWISRDLATVRRGVASKVHMAYHRILSVPSLPALARGAKNVMSLARKVSRKTALHLQDLQTAGWWEGFWQRCEFLDTSHWNGDLRVWFDTSPDQVGQHCGQWRNSSNGRALLLCLSFGPRGHAYIIIYIYISIYI